MAETTTHLHPTAALAERVLLPDDPGRALQLAQALIAEPKMFNHNRGLWGYSGDAHRDGRPLTIQSTGIGGPSTAIVVHELVELGARTLLRVGGCTALAPELGLGELVVVSEALARDGTSSALGAGSRVTPSRDLLERLRTAGADAVHQGPVVSTDLVYDRPAATETEWAAAGAIAVELEAATLFAMAARRGATAAAALFVSELGAPAARRIEPAAQADAERALGELAMRAVSPG